MLLWEEEALYVMEYDLPLQALGPIQIMALALEPLGVQLCGWWLLEPGKEGRCQASVCPQCVLEGTLGRTVPSCVPVPTTGPATPSTAPVSVSLGGSARTAHRVSCCPRKCSCHGASTHRAELSWSRDPCMYRCYFCVYDVCPRATACMWR